jgi:hypothetical protein
MHLQLLVDNEARSAVMHVLSIQSTLMQVNVGVALRLLGDLRVLSGNIESESAEFLDGDRLASYKVLSDVRYQRLPDNDHLRLGFKRLLGGSGSLSREVVFSRVRRSVLEEPGVN